MYSQNALFGKEVRSINKPPFSAVFLLVSCLFCRLVATYQHIAAVPFAENGRYMVHGVKKENKGPLSEATSISLKK
jgi:hypothetical protein